MRKADLPTVTLDARHAGELLAHPCICGRKGCTLGAHIWRSTLDMGPGAKAANTDPRSRSWPTEDDDTDDPRPDGTSELHDEYRGLVAALWRDARKLQRFIDSYRPDRILPRSEQPRGNDEDWCRNCLDHGLCNPRYRNDLCRDCYEFNLAYRDLDRPRELVMARHEGRSKIPQTMVDEAVARARRERRKRRRRAA